MHGSKRDVADLLHLSRGQRLSKRQFAINGIAGTSEIGQLLSNGFAGHFCGVFATSHIFQVIFPGALAVSSGLLSVRGIMEDIQKLLGAFSGLIEQGNILRITDIGRCAGGVHDHSAAVSASSRMIVRVVILILGFGFFGRTDRPATDLRRKTLARHHRPCHRPR